MFLGAGVLVWLLRAPPKGVAGRRAAGSSRSARSSRVGMRRCDAL